MPRKLFVRIGADDTELQKKLKGIANRMYAWGKDLEKIGKTLTRTLTLPIAGLAAGIFAFSEKAKAAFKSFGDEVKTSLGKVGDDIVRAINLSGILKTLADVIKSVANAFIALPDANKKFIVTVLALIAVIGPLLLILAKMAIAIALIASLLGGPSALIVLISAAAIAIAGFTAAMIPATKSQKEFNEELSKETDQLKRKILLQQRLSDLMKEHTPIGKFGEESEMDKIQKTINLIDKTIANQKRLSAEGIDFKASSEAAVKYTNDLDYLNRKYEGHTNTIEYLRGKYELLTTRYDENLRAGLQITSGPMVSLKTQMEGVAGAILNIQANLYTMAPAWDLFLQKLYQIPPIAVQVSTALFDIFNTFAQGIGNAIAQVLVYGESMSKMMKALFKQVLAAVISMFVQIAIQQIVAAIAGRLFAASIGSANIGVSVARAGAAAYAAAVESQGLLGIGTGAFFAALAIKGASAAAVAGKIAGSTIGAAAGGFWRGGIATVPTFATLAEREPELVIPLSRVDRILGRGGPIHVHIDVDGREIAKATLMNAPGIMRTYGVA